MTETNQNNKNKPVYRIYRPLWLRGEGHENSALYRKSDRKMCCMGHVMRLCGASLEALEDTPTPDEIKTEYLQPLVNHPVAKLLTHASPNGWPQLVCSLVEINDDTTLADTEHEARLTYLFAVGGINVVFTDDPQGTVCDYDK